MLMAATVSLLLCVIALTIYGNYLENKEYQHKTTAFIHAIEDARITTQQFETEIGTSCGARFHTVSRSGWHSGPTREFLILSRLLSCDGGNREWDSVSS